MQTNSPAKWHVIHNPPLPGLPDHALLVLNHDQTDLNNGALVYSNSSMIQLLLYDVITLLSNKLRGCAKVLRCIFVSFGISMGGLSSHT